MSDLIYFETKHCIDNLLILLTELVLQCTRVFDTLKYVLVLGEKVFLQLSPLNEVNHDMICYGFTECHIR